MKIVIVMVSFLMLSGCANIKKFFNIEPEIVTKTVYVKAKPKVVVKYVKQVPIPEPRPLDIEANLYCPTMESFPEAATLTEDEVTAVIQKLIDLNKKCHYNMTEIDRKLKEYNSRVSK